MLDKHMKYPKWQKPYLAALMEVKQEQLSAKIAVAEAAIRRLASLGEGDFLADRAVTLEDPEDVAQAAGNI